MCRPSAAAHSSGRRDRCRSWRASWRRPARWVPTSMPTRHASLHGPARSTHWPRSGPRWATSIGYDASSRSSAMSRAIRPSPASPPSSTAPASCSVTCSVTQGVMPAARSAWLFFHSTLPSRSRSSSRSTDVAASYGESLGRFSGEMLEHVRAINAGTSVPPEPRHASTVVLLRDGTDRKRPGLEAYLLRRQKTMAFAAGMYVFPGGSVDPRDEALSADAWTGPTAAEWAGILTADERLATALVCAAVRETFEESGVLLAGSAADDVVADTTGDDWEADRLALLDRTVSFAELLARRGLLLRADLLRPWAHWITPEAERRRFDTRFFVAALPDGQRTRDVGGEADRVAWCRPREALDAFERHELGLMPPTAFTLMELSAYDTVADVLAAGDARDVK